MAHDQAREELGFLDSMMKLFRREERAPEPETASTRPGNLEAEFEAAIRGLNERVQQRLAEMAESAPAEAAVPGRSAAEDRMAAKLRRMETAHRAIREDIEKMHADLETGLASANLTGLSTDLRELAASVKQGKDSQSMLPRARYAILQKLQTEAGALAVARLIELLRRRNMAWPDPTRQSGSGAAPDEAERSRQRRLAEIRESFLASGLERTGDRMLGVVTAWGSNYPERGSPLWQESVLEAVAAGLRAELVEEFVAVLQRDREQILAATEGSMGGELAALQRVLKDGVTSIDQANRAVASALQVLDELFPEVAWAHLRSQLPHARGEWSS